MQLDDDTCYRAILARDPRFDGRFYTGVASTGVYCRPICPARTPARRNMRFFRHAAAAETAGFRACRRCRPEASPGSPDWNVRADLAARAVRLITDGYVDEHGVAGLARRLAVTDRHLRRLLLAEVGTTPLALARSTRLRTARRLLAETAMPVTEIAFASGFASVRQFNASFAEAYRQPPTALRARQRAAGRPGTDGDWLSLRLACREPFDGQSLLAFLASRAIPGVEQVAAGRYRRTVRTPGGPGLIELTVPPAGGAAVPPGTGQVLLRARLAGLRGIGQVVSRCRQLLDLDADPHAIAAALAADEVLAPLTAVRPGLRVPGAYDGFELAVRAVLGQQVSVAAARTFAGRIAVRFGTPLDLAAPPDQAGAIPAAASSSRPASATGGSGPAGNRGIPRDGAAPYLLFPTAADLAEADLSGLGLTGARQATLRALATAVAGGSLSLDPGADPEETAARLAGLPGIGPWTVGYVLMRAVADPDAWPAADLGLRRALARLGCDPARAGRWRPWRAYAAMHLWSLPGAPAAGAAAPAPARRLPARSTPARSAPAGTVPLRARTVAPALAATAQE